MKKVILLTSLVFCITIFAKETPDFSMIGFASLNGGTTGGEGGEVVTVSTFTDLKHYAEDPLTPYVIRIEGEINTGITAYIEVGSGHIVTSQTASTIKTTYGEILKLGSNKTLLGIGDQAFLNRIGINIQCQSNIIIRNIKFTLQDVPVDKSGENKIVGFRNGAEVLLGDPDCIGIQADSESLPKDQRKCRNIWIDHCEFYNYPRESEHKDRYDGLLDIKNDIQFVTISWCYFHDHSKACLFGKGNSDDFDRTTTLHHNYFENIKGSRLPLLRYGRHHYFNNYQYGCEDGLNARINSDSYIENCYFEDTKRPVFGKKSESGKATLVDNIFKNCRNIPLGNENIDGAKFDVLKDDVSFDNTDFIPASLYDYIHVLNNAEDVPQVVKNYGGVGKIKEDKKKVAAFPGAEGFGKYASGGRGGRVIEVTNLQDYKESSEDAIPGSLRYALKTDGTDPVTIIFRVSGRIDLKEHLKCGRSNITIAGQTAPGAGICISGNNIYFSGKNLIIRYLRFRTGDEQQTNASCVNVENAENFIIDHCSFSWSVEENMTIYDNINSTVQWCIISEPLYSAFHSKGPRSYGMQWGGQYASYHHNLIAHAYNRVPRVNGSRAHDTNAVNDFVNNVIFNWGKKNSVYGGEVEIEGGQSLVNWVNNYYKPGPASPINSYIAQADYKNNGMYGKWYVNGNYIEGDSYSIVNEDNTKGMNYVGGEINHRSDVRFDVEDVYTTTAAEAYQDVLNYAGARIPYLDAIDKRILAEVKGELTPVYGSKKNGIIESQEDVGGWPQYIYAEAPLDTDGDGIPDEWELLNELDPNNPSDGSLITQAGYSNLENYLNSIGSSEPPVSLSEKKDNNTVCVYYDISGRLLHMNAQQTIKEIVIYRSNGVTVFSGKFDNSNLYIPLNNMTRGVYIIHTKLAGNKEEFHKIVV